MAHNIYISKYRPNTLGEVIGQEKIVNKLKRYVEANHMPHQMFEGGPGIGKTTSALALAKDLYGDNMRANFLEINASDESGVEGIRTTVKRFCQTMAVGAEWKIVFLDEVDYISQQSQAVLRRVMEKYSKRTRFILSCNYSWKILDPIKDRTSISRFQPLTEENIIEMISRIHEVDIDEPSKELIAKNSRGSMRRALNMLEDLSIGRENIRIEDARELVDSILKKDDIEVLINLLGSKNTRGLHEKTFELTRARGLQPTEILHELLKTIEGSEMSPEQKMNLTWEIGETDWRISQGSNPEIQLSCGFRRMMDVL